MSRNLDSKRSHKKSTARTKGARTRSDIWSVKKRSAVMARIGGKNTKPERIVRALLYGLGYRFRLHAANLPGRPDIVLARYRTAVLVHGCFWHLHHNCQAGRLPISNREFWQRKLEGNRTRDRRNARALRRLGWRVLTLWECEIEGTIDKVADRLQTALAAPTT